MKREVIRTKNFAPDAAEFIFKQVQAALAERDQCRVALSGGNTPRPIYRELAEVGQNLPWNRILFTFSDERCVPPEDDQSNFRMAQESLFVPANIPEQSIVRIKGEIEPIVAAQDYEEKLHLVASQQGETTYRHDLILLGVGEDGHTASLFPGTAALQERERAVVANFVPKFNSWRITFTYPLINQARQILFLANAGKNAELLEKVLARDQSYPAAQVEPSSGVVTWIIGEA